MISTGQLASAALWVAVREGPFHVDPKDPGGATAYGLALRYHPEYTLQQLMAVTPEESAAVLARQYWPTNASDLPSYLATPLLSFSVLEGPLEAVEMLQKALGVPADGKIGPQTLHAAAIPKPMQLLEDYFRACMEHLRGSPSWAVDGVGWECRQLSASLIALS